MMSQAKTPLDNSAVRLYAFVLLSIYSSGCSTATALGCLAGAGTLGVVGAVVVAGDKNRDSDNNAVTGFLGGAALGAIAGCVGAAVAGAYNSSHSGKMDKGSRLSGNINYGDERYSVAPTPAEYPGLAELRNVSVELKTASDEGTLK